MKLLGCSLKNFKGIREKTISFRGDPQGDPRPLTAFLGENGTGKTTVLQAIALVLSLATRKGRILRVEDFPWHGFLPERLSSLGPTEVELDVAFGEDEVRAVRELYELTRGRPGLTREEIPGSHEEVRLVFREGKLESPQGPDGLAQFLGRYYIQVMQKQDPELRNFYRRVGGVFWFDQFRNLVTRSGGEWGAAEPGGWSAGVERLREYLVVWWSYHVSSFPHGVDYIPDLEKAFQNVFPDVEFAGVQPRNVDSGGGIKDSLFLLRKKQRVYDIAEMSSGEQGVFPILYEFVRLRIAKSIVLVDELEMHLHPFQQQVLLAALSRLGEDCQFVLTTHSPYLEEVIPDSCEVRFGGES